MNQVKKLVPLDPDSDFFPFLLADWILAPSAGRKHTIPLRTLISAAQTEATFDDLGFCWRDRIWTGTLQKVCNFQNKSQNFLVISSHGFTRKRKLEIEKIIANLKLNDFYMKFK